MLLSLHFLYSNNIKTISADTSATDTNLHPPPSPTFDNNTLHSQLNIDSYSHTCSHLSNDTTTSGKDRADISLHIAHIREQNISDSYWYLCKIGILMNISHRSAFQYLQMFLPGMLMYSIVDLCLKFVHCCSILAILLLRLLKMIRNIAHKRSNSGIVDKKYYILCISNQNSHIPHSPNPEATHGLDNKI